MNEGESSNLQPWIEPELEARIIALVLGEASDFEVEELERLIEERPELAVFHHRMATMHGLLRKVAMGEPEDAADDWKLSAERRKAVLAVISGEVDAQAEAGNDDAADDPETATASEVDECEESAVEEFPTPVKKRKGKALRWTQIAGLSVAACLALVFAFGALMKNTLGDKGEDSRPSPPMMVMARPEDREGGDGPMPMSWRSNERFEERNKSAESWGGSVAFAKEADHSIEQLNESLITDAGQAEVGRLEGVFGNINTLTGMSLSDDLVRLTDGREKTAAPDQLGIAENQAGDALMMAGSGANRDADRRRYFFDSPDEPQVVAEGESVREEARQPQQQGQGQGQNEGQWYAGYRVDGSAKVAQPNPPKAPKPDGAGESNRLLGAPSSSIDVNGSVSMAPGLGAGGHDSVQGFETPRLTADGNVGGMVALRDSDRAIKEKSIEQLEELRKLAVVETEPTSESAPAAAATPAPVSRPKPKAAPKPAPAPAPAMKPVPGRKDGEKAAAAVTSLASIVDAESELKPTEERKLSEMRLHVDPGAGEVAESGGAVALGVDLNAKPEVREFDGFMADRGRERGKSTFDVETPASAEGGDMEFGLIAPAGSGSGSGGGGGGGRRMSPAPGGEPQGEAPQLGKAPMAGRLFRTDAAEQSDGEVSQALAQKVDELADLSSPVAEGRQKYGDFDNGMGTRIDGTLIERNTRSGPQSESKSRGLTRESMADQDGDGQAGGSQMNHWAFTDGKQAGPGDNSRKLSDKELRYDWVQEGKKAGAPREVEFGFDYKSSERDLKFTEGTSADPAEGAPAPPASPMPENRPEITANFERLTNERQFHKGHGQITPNRITKAKSPEVTAATVPEAAVSGEAGEADQMTRRASFDLIELGTGAAKKQNKALKDDVLVVEDLAEMDEEEVASVNSTGGIDASGAVNGGTESIGGGFAGKTEALAKQLGDEMPEEPKGWSKRQRSAGQVSSSNLQAAEQLGQELGARNSALSFDSGATKEDRHAGEPAQSLTAIEDSLKAMDEVQGITLSVQPKVEREKDKVRSDAFFYEDFFTADSEGGVPDANAIASRTRRTATEDSKAAQSQDWADDYQTFSGTVDADRPASPGSEGQIDNNRDSISNLYSIQAEPTAGSVTYSAEKESETLSRLPVDLQRGGQRSTLWREGFDRSEALGGFYDGTTSMGIEETARYGTNGDDLAIRGLRSGANAIDGDSIDGLITSTHAADYDEHSRNQTRSKFLSRVAEGWELPVPASGGKELSREFIYPTEYDPPEIPNEIGLRYLGDTFSERDKSFLAARGELKAGTAIEGKREAFAAQRVAPPAGLDEKNAAEEAFSTFSLHVSDVSFKLAQAALAKGEWPEAGKVRIEEFVNTFDYGDPNPTQDDKVACNVEQAVHPFLQQRNLMRVAMRTAAAGRAGDTPLRLTFLLDNSGSMERADREETVRRAFALLADQLQPIDQVTLISFARQPRLLADKVSGDQSKNLVEVVSNLPSEGGTNLEAALQLAFEKAQEQKVDNAQNRIVLLTDGAANLGNAKPESLSAMIESMREAGIAFDAAGIGADGLNDEILEALTRKGDGRYYLLDRPEDADAGFARQIAGALRPAAKNVKVQVEFNPDRVGHYKLLGFEKHLLKKEDFRDDSVDAAEMAAEEAGVAVYQFEARPDGEGDVGFVSVRFRDLSSGRMVEKRWPIPYEPSAPRPDQAAPSMQVATVAALFAAKLNGEPLGDTVELDELARTVSALPEPYQSKERVQQLRQMIDQARELEAAP